MKRLPLYFSIVSLAFLGNLTEDLQAQNVVVADGGSFYLGSGLDFSSGNSIVAVDENGTFSLEAGNTWGSATEYVDGEVEVLGTGLTKIPVGDMGAYAPVTAEHSSAMTAAYLKESPSAGSNGDNVDAVGTVEYWRLSGTAIITLPWNPESGIEDLVNNNGGNLNSVAIVGLNAGVWDLISQSQSFTVMGDAQNGDVTSDLSQASDLEQFSEITFGIDDQSALSTDDLFLNTGISILSNPLDPDASHIRFTVDDNSLDLKASLYDIFGRLIRSYDDLNLQFGEGQIPAANLKSGIYILRFEGGGRSGSKKIIIQ